VQDLSERKYKRTDVIGIITFGFFVILVGVIFAVTPNLFHRISDFVQDFELGRRSNLYIPAPRNLHAHTVFYTAVFQFCLAFAIFQVFVMLARFALKDSIDKKAGTISSLVFWFGASWIMSLLMAETFVWFVFVGWLLMLVGVSIVVKNSIVLIGHAF
jgi:hypothetical protein